MKIFNLVKLCMSVATYSSNKKRHVIICLTVQCHLNNVRWLRLPLNHGLGLDYFKINSRAYLFKSSLRLTAVQYG